ncbi:MAG: phosphate ABC transporter permease PstA [Verrucomicrobia bacterium]|nr:phosphate ABC transporter permease PstA [Verrucomicrobiota bacterium]
MNPEQEQRYQKRLKARRRADRRFRVFGILAIVIAILFLVVFFIDIIGKGHMAFVQANVEVDLHYNKKSSINYRLAVDKEYQKIVSRSVLRVIPKRMKDNPGLRGTSETAWVLATADVDQYLKGKVSRLQDREKEVVDRLRKEGRIKLKFNSGFFTRGDSKLPEAAGIWSALVGSLYVLLITLTCSVPVGVMTAIYLEEFAVDNWITRLIEVNINNLAAIPSILFGLLGLSIIIGVFGAPRSSALVGGVTLGLMMLPVIIISSRAALRAVPDSIREGATGVGASRWQVVQHHVLPLALPGIMTGTILSLAQAMGETAPLLIVGLMAYIPDSPNSVLEGATVLPAQIFTWFSDSQRAFAERTAAGILVLLVVLLTLNAGAIWLRRLTERRW